MEGRRRRRKRKGGGGVLMAIWFDTTAVRFIKGVATR